MTDEMSIETYLAQGGVLSSPANVPARYRGELLRLMATFVDSELAGAAGFADVINAARAFASVSPRPALFMKRPRTPTGYCG